MARKKDLAGLAALGALGYMMSKGKGDAITGDDQYNPDVRAVERNEDYSNEGRTPVRAPIRTPSAGGSAPTAPSRISVDDEAGMTRGTRPRDPRDPRDAEAGMSRGTRRTSMAGAGRGSVNPPAASSTPDMSAYVPRRTPQAASSTEEGMRGYVPRRTPVH